MAKNLKFEWTKVVNADIRLTNAERRILIHCATHLIFGKQDTFAVCQTTIAEQCACGVATVKRAITHAREFGYLVTTQRQRGRGHRRGDANRITFPNPGIVPTPEIGITPEPSLAQEIGINGTEIGINHDTNRDQPRTEIGINHAPKPASDQLVSAPQGSLKKGSSTKKGSTTKEQGSTNRSQARGTRLPEGWKPANDIIEKMAVELGCDRQSFAYEHRKFTDYWLDKTGKDATKRTWDRTWCNWMRRASEQGSLRHISTNGHPVNGRTLPTSDQRVAAILAMKTTNPHRQELTS